MILATATTEPAQGGPWMVTDIGTLGGATSDATDINEAGQVVGRSGERRGARVPLDSGGWHGRSRHARRPGLEERGRWHQRRWTGGRPLRAGRRSGVHLDSAASNEIHIHVNVPVAPSAPANLLGLVNGSSLALAWTNPYAGGSPRSLVLDVTRRDCDVDSARAVGGLHRRRGP